MKVGDIVKVATLPIAKFCKTYHCYLEPTEDGFVITQGEMPVNQLEAIRRMRMRAYELEADPIKFDYEKAVARDDSKAESLKKQWLSKCDEIKARYPY